ncbi:hypothetical protein SSX86_011101 [Deinandra increscens subsp. villosa]|uniref:Reverse transcriptase zinc-binding domain-containing protein n=1 Tax=Deinandra increscens subsp. villosa TaxID=3103831 RepID=A0AAP0D976_9ASTR
MENWIKNSDGRWVWNSGSSALFQSEMSEISSAMGREAVTVSSYSGANQFLASKVNILYLRAQRKRITTFVAIHRRNIPINSQVCRLCNERDETTTHLFIGCRLSYFIWQRTGHWCEVPPFLAFSIDDLLSMHKDKNVDNKNEILQGIILTSFRCIWKKRNAVVFHGAQPSVN